MRTEGDLRAALAARETLAPESAEVLAGAEQAVDRRRRRTAVSAAAAMVAVAAISLPVLVLRGDPATDDTAATDPGAPPPLLFDPAARPPFSFTVDPGSVPGADVSPWRAAPEHEIWSITPIGEDGPLALFIYAPGADLPPGLDGSLHEDETPTEVGGAPAWFSTAAGTTEAERRWETAELRWEYAPDAYAVLANPSDGPSPPFTKDALREVAEAVEFTTPQLAKLPYRLDYLPADVMPSYVDQNQGDESGSMCNLEDVGSGTTVSIQVGDLGPVEGSEPDWQDTTIAGHPAQCAPEDSACKVDLEGLAVTFVYANLAEDELERIVAGMTVATWEDPATWYEIDEALPAR